MTADSLLQTNKKSAVIRLIRVLHASYHSTPYAKNNISNCAVNTRRNIVNG